MHPQNQKRRRFCVNTVSIVHAAPTADTSENAHKNLADSLSCYCADTNDTTPMLVCYFHVVRISTQLGVQYCFNETSLASPLCRAIDVGASKCPTLILRFNPAQATAVTLSAFHLHSCNALTMPPWFCITNQFGVQRSHCQRCQRCSGSALPPAASPAADIRIGCVRAAAHHCTAAASRSRAAIPSALPSSCIKSPLPHFAACSRTLLPPLPLAASLICGRRH